MGADQLKLSWELHKTKGIAGMSWKIVFIVCSTVLLFILGSHARGFCEHGDPVPGQGCPTSGACSRQGRGYSRTKYPSNPRICKKDRRLCDASNCCYCCPPML